jgi:hypothetical protein
MVALVIGCGDAPPPELSFDAGAPDARDAGVEADAGAERDAGVDVDAGADPDAGVEADAGVELDREPAEAVVILPADWRQLPVFAARYSAPSASTIDLAATRFQPTSLRGPSGREFGGPSADGFRSQLLRAAFDGVADDLHVVQARAAEEMDALRARLDGMQVSIHSYIPRNAYLVRVTPTQRDALALAPEVSWIGLYQPAWRIAPKLDYLIEYELPRELTLTALFDPMALATEQEVRAAAQDAGFEVVELARRSRDWKVRLSGSTDYVDALAFTRGCKWVERFAGFVLHNNVARTSVSTATGRGGSGPIMDVEDVWARGIRGEGQIASAADTGLSTGDTSTLHADFGVSGSGTNPMRVIAGYALGRSTWDDDQNDGGGHGTHTSGSIVGNGFRSGSDPGNDDFPTSSYAGTAPKAQLVFQSILDGSGGLGGLPADLNDLFQQAYDDGARVHSNSWGSSAAGVYSSDSQDVDEFVWDNPDMVITFSAGNAGADGRAVGFPSGMCSNTGDPIDGVIDTDSIGPPGTAKNNITVGASENYRPDFVYEYPENDCTVTDAVEQQTWGWFNGCSYSVDPINSDKMADDASGLGAFSSRGPTDDGRFKPDVVAPGIGIISTRTDVNQAYEQWGICNVPAAYQSYYFTSGGTSMSNPLTAGAATLVRQYYADGWHPNNSRRTNAAADGADAFSPSAALVKATLINGAWSMAPGQYGTGTTQEIPPGWESTDVPNNAEGFGRVDVESALFAGSGYGANAGRKTRVDDVSAGLTTNDTHTVNVTVSSNGGPLVATLVWSDPYGDTAAATQLVNDLDLTAESPSGDIYSPNGVDLLNLGASGDDDVNTVEQVTVSAPEVGVWTLTVTAETVPGNGVSGTTTQPFALVTSGILEPLCTDPSTPTGLSATPVGDNRIDLSWGAVSSDSYKVYRATTSGGPYSEIASGLVTNSYSDTVDVSGGVTYYYVVTAFVDPECESTQSGEASATASGDCVTPPTFDGLQSVTSDGGGGCKLSLSWSAATDNCGASVVYNVYRSETSSFTPGPGNLLASCLTDTGYDDVTVADATPYYYVVRAEDAQSGQGGACRGGNEEANSVEGAGTPVGADVTSTVYSHDFETGSGLDDWGTGRFGGGSPTIEWFGIQTCTAHGGTKIFRFGDTSCTGTYGGGRFQFAQPEDATGVAIASDASNATLTFWHRWDFEADEDGGFMALSFDGSSYTIVDSAHVSGTGYNGTLGDNSYPAWTDPDQTTFVQSTVDLDAACDDLSGGSNGCAGRDLYIAFTVYTDSSGAEQGWFLDDVIVTADAPGSCVVEPEAPTALTATAKDGEVQLEWRNPASNYGSTRLRYRTDTWPTDESDGTLVGEQAGGAGAADTMTHSGLTNGTTYYYAAFVDGGSGVFSTARTVSARPMDTSGAVKWAYSTGASSMAPPGIGSVFAVSNDRMLHSMQAGASGGYWPSGWQPFTMNGAAQSRPVVVPVSVGSASKVVFLTAQDGYAYAVNAGDGASVWTSPLLGTALVASPAAMFTQYGGAHDLVFVATRNGGADNQLHALALNDGAIAWSFDDAAGDGIGIIAGTPAVSYGDTRLFFASHERSSGDDSAWCLSFNGNSASKVWSTSVGDVETGPVLSGGRVYLGNTSGELYALDASSGTASWSAPYATSDGAVKDTVWVSGSDLVFSTSGTVWGVSDDGASASLRWSVTSISSPSAPLVVSSDSRALVGGGNGRLYQLDFSSLPPTVTSVQLDASAAIGSPALDVSTNLIHVGSESGAVYAVSYPLP